jgi:zinc protease
MYTLEDFGAKRYEAKLNNGVRVVLFYRPKAPICAQAFLHSGSSFDQVGKEGMSHFLEHMILCGSKKFPTKSDLCEHIESVGGITGAMTSSEYLIVNTEVPEKEDFCRAVDVFEATLCNPLMDEKVFENEKEVVMKEITKNQSVPEKLLYKTAGDLMFKNTRHEHRPTGNLSSVKSITHEEMFQVYKNLLDVSRLTFVVSGDISINEITDQLNKLTFFSENPYTINNEPLKITFSGRIESLFADLKQTYLFVGFYSAPIFSKQFLCMEIVGRILTTGRTGRLVKNIRYEKGLVYSLSFFKFQKLLAPVHGIVTDTTEDKVQTVVSEILKEIDLLKEKGITQDEFDFAKNKLVKSIKRDLQTSYSWTNFHSFGEALGPIEYFSVDDYVNVINAMTLEEVNETIKEYLSSDKAYVATVGRTKAEDIKI